MWFMAAILAGLRLVRYSGETFYNGGVSEKLISGTITQAPSLVQHRGRIYLFYIVSNQLYYMKEVQD